MDGVALAMTCCGCCVATFIGVSFAIQVARLSISRMTPDRPNSSIEYFYVPALNKSLDSQLNNTINFMVNLDNPHGDAGIYYDDVQLTLSTLYTTTNSSAFIANYTVPRFYQGHKKKAKKWGQVTPANNQTVLPAVLPSGLAVFRLDLTTKVRFKMGLFNTKKLKYEVGADVQVNGDGVKAKNEGIKMHEPDYYSPSSPSLRSYLPVCILINLLVFFAI